MTKGNFPEYGCCCDLDPGEPLDDCVINVGHWDQDHSSSVNEALCRAIEREAATAAELRELKERFSEVAAKVSCRLKQSSDANVNWIADLLAIFILPAPDPLVEAIRAMALSDATQDDADRLRAALQARGYQVTKIGEAGE